MRRMICRYPGDPPVTVTEMSRSEFFDTFPPDDRKMTITAYEPGGAVASEEVIPMGAEIHCDMCNADPGDKLYLLGRSRAYCPACFKEGLERYCKLVPEGRAP